MPCRLSIKSLYPFIQILKNCADYTLQTYQTVPLEPHHFLLPDKLSMSEMNRNPQMSICSVYSTDIYLTQVRGKCYLTRECCIFVEHENVLFSAFDLTGEILIAIQHTSFTILTTREFPQHINTVYRLISQHKPFLSMM